MTGSSKPPTRRLDWTLLDLDLEVEDLAVDPSDTSVVYASSTNDGVFKSTDGGNSWAEITPA